PGKAADSRLYKRVAGLEQPAMPLGNKLSDREVQILKDWIDNGARWEGGPLIGSTKPAAPANPKSWWAFQRPVRPAVPQNPDRRWNANPIDGFVKAELDRRGLVPAPRADKRTLIRRAYLDLTGLLPAPAEVEEFLKDESADAYAKVLDRLLASSSYGERWGRHWLDLVRYADSWGHIHDDDNPNAWRYRDYVIDSFNKDKPYDRFIIEQLAGDELDEVTPETLIATSYGRVGPRVRFREKQNPHYRYDYLDDLIGTTSRGFLALTVNCARCHDHKFDPISQKDYYRMMASFFPFVDYDHPLMPADEYAAYTAKKAAVERQTRPLKAAIKKIEEPYRLAAFEKKLKTFPEDIQVAVHTPEEKRTSGQKLLAAQVLSIATVGRKEMNLPAAELVEVRELDARIKALEATLPQAPPMAAGIRDGDYRFTPDGPGDEPVPGTTANRIVANFKGSYVPAAGEQYQAPPLRFPAGDANGKEVPPGFLTVLAEGNPATAHPPSRNPSTSGRRRALAEWIASKDNPLTARVMVNRLWQHHFGRGIVDTPSNFGKMGMLPTHPQLLDWLATEFLSQGWSVKKIQRLIMLSETYQMASTFYNEKNLAQDAGNVYLWRFPLQRLEAETIRDIILAASGQLNRKAGGPPFFPALPPAVREDVKKMGRWELTKEEPGTWRRSVYSYFKRAMKYPMFEVLDSPDSNISCERRGTTTVPTQALTLMNDEFILIQARLFAQRVFELAGDDPAAQIQAVYRIALSREPEPGEFQGNVRFLEKQRAYHSARPPLKDNAMQPALTDLCAVVLNLNEFVYIN
ncbi:MAG TPA: DUF1549 and DUF1553 domain-containing protein, partial [Bryobacteraceae bacterium]|nr:DUF1549 and DUF1553 domain-containing protein [Bryobacteraceae bacterium]